MLTPIHRLLLKTVQEPSMGGAALAALQLDYITYEEWEELRALRERIGDLCDADIESERKRRAWCNLRLMLACFVLLAEGHDPEV